MEHSGPSIRVSDKALGVIPARFASSRLPGKPLKLIAGKTMIQRTYERAKQAKKLDALIVATDDQRIVDHVLEFGGEAMLTSSECRTGSDRCWDLYNRLRQIEDPKRRYDILINIQGDEPLVDPTHIDALIEAVQNDPTLQISAAAAPILTEEDALNPNVTKVVMDCNNCAIYFSRAMIPNSKKAVWNPDTAYFKNCGMYCFRVPFLEKYTERAPGPLQKSEDLEQLKVLEMGVRLQMVVVDRAAAGIDTQEQLDAMDKMLTEQESK